MRIIGIDPGYATIGVGVVDYSNTKFKTVEYGAITTPAKTDFSQRLKIIHDDLVTILLRTKPDALAIEKLYFNTNKTTAIDVAQARGVILVCAANLGIPYFEYTPLQIKQAVVGYGRAEKKQVMEMTKSILSLSAIPKPDDTADALAIAICHAHSYKANLYKKY